MDKKLLDQWWALREDKSNKIRYDLLPLEQLTKLALHYTNWCKLHWDRNWEWGNMEFADKCKQSAWRHFVQRQSGASDEDHASALIFNIRAYEFLKDKNSKQQFDKMFEQF